MSWSRRPAIKSPGHALAWGFEDWCYYSPCGLDPTIGHLFAKKKSVQNSALSKNGLCILCLHLKSLAEVTYPAFGARQVPYKNEERQGVIITWQGWWILWLVGDSASGDLCFFEPSLVISFLFPGETKLLHFLYKFILTFKCWWLIQVFKNTVARCGSRLPVCNFWFVERLSSIWFQLSFTVEAKWYPKMLLNIFGKFMVHIGREEVWERNKRSNDKAGWGAREADWRKRKAMIWWEIGEGHIWQRSQ